ncbi:MAG: hypothetical protein LBL36_00460 [Clostridiales Family XIII bacterium]|nr:hypothetical protein [Clostridiales Family XIII bacterium]
MKTMARDCGSYGTMCRCCWGAGGNADDDKGPEDGMMRMVTSGLLLACFGGYGRNGDAVYW